MTDAPPAAPENTASKKKTRPDSAARDSYLASLRRGRLLYASILAVVVLVIGVAVTIAYQHGEATHTTLVTVAKAPPTVTTQALANPSGRKWTSTDKLAINAPYDAGTVVTFDAHTVRGHDGRTGKQTWSYTRSNRTMCTVAQSKGVTLALFRVKGNCDQLTALDSQLGTELWTRTYSKDGHPINGTPTVLVSNDTLLLSTPSVIYATAIARDQGLDRWQFSREDCVLGSVAYGSAGALISMNCTNTESCKSEEKFCAIGPQLILREPYAGQDDSKSENPDMIKWNVASDATPAAAESQILARDGDDLVILGETKGKERARIQLTKPGTSSETQSLSDSDLVWTGGTLYSVLDADLLWTLDTLAMPTLTGLNGQEPSVTEAIAVVPGERGVNYLDTTDGTVAHTTPLSGVDRNSKVYPYGAGFIVENPNGITVWT